mgnify:CR=1 FL=1
MLLPNNIKHPAADAVGCSVYRVIKTVFVSPSQPTLQLSASESALTGIRVLLFIMHGGTSQLNVLPFTVNQLFPICILTVSAFLVAVTVVVSSFHSTSNPNSSNIFLIGTSVRLSFIIGG